MRALECWAATGDVVERCDVCYSPIRFQAITGSAATHECDCGKFTGSLRGL